MPRRGSGPLRQRGTGGEEKRARSSSGDARLTGFIVSSVFYFLMDTTAALFLEVLWKAIGLTQLGQENDVLACLMYTVRSQRCCCMRFLDSATLLLAILQCTLFRYCPREVTLKDQKSLSPRRVGAEVRWQKEKALERILNARTCCTLLAWISMWGFRQIHSRDGYGQDVLRILQVCVGVCRRREWMGAEGGCASLASHHPNQPLVRILSKLGNEPRQESLCPGNFCPCAQESHSIGDSADEGT